MRRNRSSRPQIISSKILTNYKTMVTVQRGIARWPGDQVSHNIMNPVMWCTKDTSESSCQKCITLFQGWENVQLNWGASYKITDQFPSTLQRSQEKRETEGLWQSSTQEKWWLNAMWNPERVKGKPAGFEYSLQFLTITEQCSFLVLNNCSTGM